VFLYLKRVLNKGLPSEFNNNLLFNNMMGALFMGLFGKTKKKNENKYLKTPIVEVEVEVEEEDVYLVIHYTPVATYVYISEEGSIDSYDGYLEMQDLDENHIMVSGTFTQIEIDSVSEVERTIEKFGLKSSVLPVIQIKVKPY
jgi:hypothetical protein